MHGNQLHIQNPHESTGCYMDMVEQAKQHGSNVLQNEHESTMCGTAGNTHFCTCSCGHGGLEVAKAWVIAPVGHIPEVVLVALVYVAGPVSDPCNELGCLIVHPQPMEDSKVDPPVPVALLQSWCLWLGSFGHGSGAITWATCSWCLQQHMALETNVSRWQCKQLGIPPALGTGATPARLLSSVANIYCQKTGLNHLGYKDLTAGATMGGAGGLALELLELMASTYA